MTRKRGNWIAKKHEIPWLRLGAESVAIVGSILLAFAIDAWWAELSDRRAESEELSRLDSEFIWNRDRINGIRDMQLQARDASMNLLELFAEHANGSERVSVPDTMISLMLQAPTFEAATPVLEGLVLSGRLEIIQDRGVLSAIAEWDRGLTQVTEAQLAARQEANMQLRSILVARGNMRQVLTTRRSGAALDGETVLLLDDELEGHVASRLDRLRGSLNALDALERYADNVLGAIEQAQSN